VRGDRHRRRPVPDRGVDLVNVAQVQVLGVLAPPGDLGALRRIVQVRQGRVVELQVGKVLAEDGVVQPDLAADMQRRRSPIR